MRVSHKNNMFTIQHSTEPDLEREIMLTQSNHINRKNDEFSGGVSGEDLK